MNNKRLVGNASWIIACRIIQSVLAFFIGMISARYLGPSNYGLISYAASIVSFVVPITQLGLRNTLVEEVISNPKHEGEIMGTSLAMTVTSSLFGIIGIISFASIANAGERDTIIVCALHSIGLIFQMTELIQYWFQAKLLSKYTSVVSLIAYVGMSAYKVYLLVTQKSIYWFSVTSAVDYLLISVVLIGLYTRLGNQRLSFSLSRARKLVKKSKYYIVSGVMVVMFAQMDKVMIKMIVGDAENGYYSVAVTCAGMAGFVFQAVIDSFRPLIFECKKNNNIIDYEKNMVRLYSIVLYLGVLQSVFFTIFSPFIIGIIYGEKYTASILLLQIITWYSSFAYIGSVRNIWILAENKQKYVLIINLIGVILNLIGNIVLITLMGAVGAAIATVITQIFTNFVLSFIIKPIRPNAGFIIKSLNPKVILGMIPKKNF